MKTLQCKGRALVARSALESTFNLSSAYHHIEMNPDSTPCLGFEWEGVYCLLTVLPFGLSSAQWLFSKVINTVL